MHTYTMDAFSDTLSARLGHIRLQTAAAREAEHVTAWRVSVFRLRWRVKRCLSSLSVLGVGRVAQSRVGYGRVGM